MSVIMYMEWLQTAQLKRGGAKTAVCQSTVQIVLTHRPQQRGHDLPFFCASRPCRPVVDVETNPGPTTTHKQVWVCRLNMRRYPPSTIYRYLDLTSTQIIQNHNTHTQTHNTTVPNPAPPDTTHTTTTQTHVPQDW